MLSLMTIVTFITWLCASNSKLVSRTKHFLDLLVAFWLGVLTKAL